MLRIPNIVLSNFIEEPFNVKISREINKQKDRLVRASQAVIRNFLICIGDISKNQFGLLVFEKAKITFNESKGKKLFKMQIYRDDFVSYPERP